MTTDLRIDELEQQVLTLQRRLVEAEAKSIRAEEQLSRVTVEVAIRDAIAKSAVPVAPATMADVIRRAAQAVAARPAAVRRKMLRPGRYSTSRR